MNKHTATYDGHTFKRTSAERLYSHTVLTINSVADARARSEKWARDSWASNLPYRREIVAGTIAAHQEKRAVSQAIIDGGPDAAAAESLTRFDAEPRLLSSDGLRYYTNAGWCSRLDLARKLQAKYAGSVIVEAVVLP